MNTTKHVVRSRSWQKTIILWMMFGAMLGLTTGCQVTDDQQESDVCGFLESIAVDTEKSIANRNTNLARDVWSQLTEYSVMAEAEDARLAKAISNVASTYATLVKYCDSGDQEKLTQFLSDFAKESKALAKLLDNEGFEVEELENRINGIVNQSSEAK